MRAHRIGWRERLGQLGAATKSAVAAALIVLSVGYGLATPGHAQTEGIAAVVNDDVVTQRQLAQRARLAMAVSGTPPTDENFQQIAPQILSALINEELQMQEAERLNIVVTDAEIDDQLNQIAARNNMSADQLNGALRGAGVDATTLRDQVRARLGWVQVARRQVGQRVIVTEGQVASALRQASSGEEEFRLAEIFLPIYQPDQEERVSGDARRVVNALQRGADFGALAQQFSAAPSAARGGDLGWLPISGLPPELRDRVNAMVDGEVTPPVRTQQGIFLFKRLARRGGDPALRLDLVEVVGTFGGFDETEVRQGFDRLRIDSESCDGLIEAAATTPGISATRRPEVVLDELDEPLATMTLTQLQNTLGAPIESSDGLRAIMVCGRVGGPELPAPNVVQQRLVEEQMDRLATRYLRNLRQDAFIDIRI